MGLSYVIVETSPVDIAIAVAFTALGFVLAEKAYDEYSDTTDLLEEVNQRRLDMAKVLYAHQLTVTHAFQKTAMDHAFNTPVHTPDYGGQCSLFKNSMLTSFTKAKEAKTHYKKMFCIDDDSCDGVLGYYTGIAASDGAFHRTQQQKQREIRNLETKVSSIHTTHAGTFRSPSAMYGLMENASAIFGYIQGQAFSNLSGSLSLFSLGLNGLMGIFGGTQ